MTTEPTRDRSASRGDQEPIEVGVRMAPAGAAEDGGRLLTFYDGLRRRIRAYLERQAPGLDARVVDTLLAAPDFFVLLLRLSLDRNVPVGSRRLIAGALAYFVLPLDLVPEALVGPVGYLDDVVFAATVIGHVMDERLEPWVDRYWSGDRRVRQVLRDVSDSARALLGGGVFGRLQRLLRQRGVEL
ncbi:MAG TPA: DUF1232 domain-containing protein [Thermoanaerobaculia bacterium]|nr:DUF1232 domain-containing protein [Thermoanaerobaculia bacterium]